MSARTRAGRRPADAEADERSRRLAGLVGPALLAISASEAVNLDLVREQYRSVSYLDGSLVFVAGLSLVRAHDRWVAGWPVVLTLTGWTALLGGLLRMFAPRPDRSEAGPGARAGTAVAFGAGVLLTAEAYARGPRRAAG
ncbi:hypothetical protein [Geodermatophilus sp. SYSU D00684]